MVRLLRKLQPGCMVMMQIGSMFKGDMKNVSILIDGMDKIDPPAFLFLFIGISFIV